MLQPLYSPTAPPELRPESLPHLQHDSHPAAHTAREGLTATDLTGELVTGATLSGPLLAEVQQLRERSGVADDLRTDLTYLFEAQDTAQRRSLAVFLRSSGHLHAVAVFHELLYVGVPTGVYLAGDIVGDGAFIGDPAEAAASLLSGAKLLLEKRPLAHTIRICVNIASPLPSLAAAPGLRVAISHRPVQRRLTLASSFPEMLKRFGKHTRRHLNRKRVILEESGTARFVPSLPAQAAFRAMVSLTGSVSPARSIEQHLNRYKLLRRRPETFVMGLQQHSGEWLSVLAGWRSGPQTFIDLQMNDFHFASSSISAVMRSYMLEHEIALGQTGVTFVGGSSLLLHRYCEADESCLDVLLQRDSLRARLAETFARRLAPPEFLDFLYNGNTSTQGDLGLDPAGEPF